MLQVGDRIRIIGKDYAHQGRFQNKTGKIAVVAGSQQVYAVRIDDCQSSFCVTRSRTKCFYHAFYASEVVKLNESKVIKII